MNELQAVEFNVLMEIRKILNAHNLRYYAIGGTCIGAIRHGGFIPWDDDVDIGMPRADYELFKNKFYKELPEAYEKLDYNDVACVHHEFIKIYDSRTTQIDFYAKDYPERYTGAFVDIMPIDGFPNDVNKGEHLLRRIQLLARLNRFNRPYIYYQEPKKLINRVNRLIKLYTPKIHRFDYYMNKIKDEMSKYDFDKSKKVLFTWRSLSPISEKRKIYDKAIFDSAVEVPFESGYINVPCKYDEYLTQDFGDYMKFPPIEKQKNHKAYISDMHTPCEYYREKFKKEGAV